MSFKVFIYQRILKKVSQVSKNTKQHNSFNADYKEAY